MFDCCIIGWAYNGVCVCECVWSTSLGVVACLLQLSTISCVSECISFTLVWLYVVCHHRWILWLPLFCWFMLKQSRSCWNKGYAVSMEFSIFVQCVMHVSAISLLAGWICFSALFETNFFSQNQFSRLLVLDFGVKCVYHISPLSLQCRRNALCCAMWVLFFIGWCAHLVVTHLRFVSLSGEFRICVSLHWSLIRRSLQWNPISRNALMANHGGRKSIFHQHGSPIPEGP